MPEEIYKRLRSSLIPRLESLGFTFGYLFDEYKESGVPSWISFGDKKVSLRSEIDYKRDTSLFEALTMADSTKIDQILENPDSFILSCLKEMGFVPEDAQRNVETGTRLEMAA